MRDFHSVVTDPGDDRAARLERQRLGSKYARYIARKKFDEERGYVCSGVGNRGGIQALLADLVERGEVAVGADQLVLIFFLAALHAAHQHYSREPRVLQDALTNQLRDHPR